MRRLLPLLATAAFAAAVAAAPADASAHYLPCTPPADTGLKAAIFSLDEVGLGCHEARNVAIFWLHHGQINDWNCHETRHGDLEVTCIRHGLLRTEAVKFTYAFYEF